MSDDDPGCLSLIVVGGFVIALAAGMLYLGHASYVKRKAHCKAQGGQWMEAMAWDDSKCLEAAERVSE